jgi:transcriptional regulator GlxA family with amidase domain
MTIQEGLPLSLDELSRIRATATLLQKDISLHYPIPILAQMVLLNRKKLQGLFATEYGMGPYAYLQELRVLKAKEMLLANQNIRRISISTGFNGIGAVNNFTKFFKRKTGHSPIAWKRMQQSRTTG